MWRLFLPAVWRAVLAEGNYHLVDKIITCLKGRSGVPHDGEGGEGRQRCTHCCWECQSSLRVVAEDTVVSDVE